MRPDAGDAVFSGDVLPLGLERALGPEELVVFIELLSNAPPVDLVIGVDRDGLAADVILSGLMNIGAAVGSRFPAAWVLLGPTEQGFFGVL